MYLKEGGRRHKFGKKCRHFGVHEPLVFQDNSYRYASSGNVFGSSMLGGERIISSSSSGYTTGLPVTTGLVNQGYSSSAYTSGTTYSTGSNLVGGTQFANAPLGTTGLAGTGGQFID
jgi:hypothetical protein